MNQLRDVLLQLFFALGPFILFNVYYRDKLRNYSRSFIIATSSVCLLLAMTFASSVVNGVIFDIRYVMMFFGLVYGGIQTGVILLIEFIVYRLYLGGEGKWISMVILAVSFSFALIFYQMYKRTHSKSLATFLAGIVFSIIPLALTYAYFTDYVRQHLAFHIIVLPVQNCLGIWLLMSLFSKSVSDKDMFIKHAQHEKLETMSHVAASLAHEVRNPLTAVKGFLKLMKEQPQEHHKIKQYIEISLDEIQRTESILSEYLSISKPPAERREIVDLSEQLQIIADVMTPYATMQNVELKVHRPVSPVAVMANPDEIKQVLVNFSKNAVEACSKVATGKVILSLMNDDQHAKLSIKDNGVGMANEQMKRLGTIYFSTKSSGTGLGLTYSYQVIHAIGGTVAVSSKAQAGTIFTITIPLWRDK
jgi:two-component system sporulation sensor kinase B